MRVLKLKLLVVCAVVLLLGAAPVALGDGDEGAVSFSTNGMDEWWGGAGFDGLPVPGMPIFNPPWCPGMGPVGNGPWPPKRLPMVPFAVGIPTFRPGDVFDYWLGWWWGDMEIFQSEPDRSAVVPSNVPNGTNNQILTAFALGLRGPGYEHGNVNAYTFGEDFFNGDEKPINGGPVYMELWEYRGDEEFDEPVVAGGGLPIRFYFSVDPWAIGLAGTKVQDEATNQGTLSLPVGPPGSADVDTNTPVPPYGLGPWRSDGEAAGDVFSAQPITSPGINIQVHDEGILALLGPKVDPNMMEDDLDALENVGTNTLFDGTAAEPGNTHDRVVPTGGANGGKHPPDLGDPTNPNHDPCGPNPIIFSVDRSTWGIWQDGSAVAAQVADGNEGACGDLFIAVTIMDPCTGMPVTTNMLLVDEGQLGLMPHDDLDAVIVRLLIDSAELEARIEEAAGNFNSERISAGYGFTFPLLNPGEAVVGFSVDTSSIGLLFTAVDFECRVDGLGLPAATPPGSGVMEQAGDIFFSNLLPVPGSAVDPGTGLTYGQNYLWFEEVAIGLDRGAWSFIGAPSGDLGDLPDELNALDSLFGEEEKQIKWEQPPCLDDPNCMDVDATDDQWMWWAPQALADDFNCTTTGLITDIHIWGSWLWDEPPYYDPNHVWFTLCLYSNDPCGPMGYSEPNELLWTKEFHEGEFDVEIFAEGPEAYYIPCEPAYFPDSDWTCWLYSFYIDPCDAFVQEGDPCNPVVYWLAVQAHIYDPDPMEEWRFGWKNSSEQWNDDAVWAQGLLPGPLGPWEELRHPMTGDSVDLAFKITTKAPPPPPPANDDCNDAEPVGNVTDLPFDTTSATFDGSGTCMYSPNIWYCYTATCTGVVTVSLCGSSYDTMLAVYDGCTCDPLGTQLGCNDDYCGLQSEISFVATAGSEYLIEVGGYALNTGQGLLTISCEPFKNLKWSQPPIEMSQPAGLGLLHGSSPWMGSMSLSTVNPSTGLVTIIGPFAGAPSSITEIEWSPDGSTLYATTGGGISTIHTIDPTTGTVLSMVGQIPPGTNLQGLEFDASGVLLGTQSPGMGMPSDLVTVNTVTGVLTMIGPTGFGPIGGLAFDSGFNTLYGITSGLTVPPILLSVNPSTGAAAQIAVTTMTAEASSLEFTADGRLVTAGNDSNFYEINPTTGVATLIGPLVNEPKLSGLSLRPTPPVYCGWDEHRSREIITFECWGPACKYQCRGDADCKMIAPGVPIPVSLADLDILKAAMGKSYPDPNYNPCADFDRNLIVDPYDLITMRPYLLKFESELTPCTPWVGGVPPGPGTEYYDLFAVSLTPDGNYWDLVNGGNGTKDDPLVSPDPAGSSVTDPTTKLGGVAWGFGGLDWGDGFLDTDKSSHSITLMGEPNYYLSVVLDTSTTPEHDKTFPSWGTISNIVVTPLDANGDPCFAAIEPNWVKSLFAPIGETLVTPGVPSSVTLASNDFNEDEMMGDQEMGIWGAAARLPSDACGYKVTFDTNVSTWDSYDAVGPVPPALSWEIVADDFRCLGTMPITSIRWWGSYVGWDNPVPPIEEPEAWRIMFWSNVPAGINYSYPEELLWQIEVRAVRVEVKNVGQDNFPEKPSDTCFEYYVELLRDECFWQNDFLDQTMDDTFWLSIAPLYPIGSPFVDYPWGWKTRPWSWMDDAVVVSLPGEPFQGIVLPPMLSTPIEYAGESYDVCFELDTDPRWIKWQQPFTGIRNWPHYEDEESWATIDIMGEPNIVRLVADDWPCDTSGPVSAVVWWGSYIGYNYEACQGPPVNLPVKPDYFRLNIWTDVPASPPYLVVDDFDSYGPDPALRTIWKDYWSGSLYGKNGAEVFRETSPGYVINGNSMRYAYRNYNSKGPIYYGSEAEANAPDLGAGTDWAASGAEALVLYFYGDPINGTDHGSGYVYPLTEDQMYVALEDGDGNVGIVLLPDMNDIKEPFWHEWNIELTDPCLADVNLANVAKVYIGFGGQKVGQTVRGAGSKSAKHDTVWFDDIKLQSSMYQYSHPNDIIWEYRADSTSYDEVLVGYDKHPEGEPNEPVFRYSVRVPEEDRFWQENTDGVYWLSVVAVYEDVPDYPWGWTNHRHVYNDDAVAGTWDDANGIWIWEELFDQTETSEDMSFMLFSECMNPSHPAYNRWLGGANMANEVPPMPAAPWSRPACWCYPRQCRGDIMGQPIAPGVAVWVSGADVIIFRNAVNKMYTAPNWPAGGICADLDHAMIAPGVAMPVSGADVVILRLYVNRMDVPFSTVVPCCDNTQDCVLTVGDDFNFWTGSTTP